MTQQEINLRLVDLICVLYKIIQDNKLDVSNYLFTLHIPRLRKEIILAKEDK